MALAVDPEAFAVGGASPLTEISKSRQSTLSVAPNET
jgi:hypothetical protein